jgi:hypothetical protein
MRRFLAKFMLALMMLWLPFQPANAITMPFCQHAGSHAAQAQRTSHHCHEHNQAGAQHDSSQPAKLNLSCDHCGSCSLCTAPALPLSAISLPGLPSGYIKPWQAEVFFVSYVPERLQRPPLLHFA